MGVFFRTFRRLLTGDLLRRIDTKIMDGKCTMSLQLKRDLYTNSTYIVLAGIAGGYQQFWAFELDEFDRFAQAVQEIRAQTMEGVRYAIPAQPVASSVV